MLTEMGGIFSRLFRFSISNDLKKNKHLNIFLPFKGGLKRKKKLTEVQIKASETASKYHCLN